MTRPKGKYTKKSHCKACCDKKDGGTFLINGTSFSVKRWDCQHRFVVYVVRCRCRWCKLRPAFYVGETEQRVEDRFRNNRCIQASTELAAHFRNVHPGVKIHTKIQIYIVSGEIRDVNERVAVQNEWICKMREAAIFEDTVLNMYPVAL